MWACPMRCAVVYANTDRPGGAPDLKIGRLCLYQYRGCCILRFAFLSFCATSQRYKYKPRAWIMGRRRVGPTTIRKLIIQSKFLQHSNKNKDCRWKIRYHRFHEEDPSGPPSQQRFVIISTYVNASWVGMESPARRGMYSA